nr:putative ribonuclease H-like domain-containing protein [Tanacetum cinerariifolium]
TKIVNTVGPVNTATLSYADYPNDPLMPNLKDAEIFDDAYDDRDEGVEADYNNLEIVISVSPIPSTRIHKDHPKEHIIGEEELLQFKLLNVWTLVDLSLGKRAIGTKWVYRNKRDQRGIIVKNKARMIWCNMLVTILIQLVFSFLDFINITNGHPFTMSNRQETIGFSRANDNWFVQLIINHQLGDMTHHKDIFDTSSLTKKVFANIKRKHKPKRKHTKEPEVSLAVSQPEHNVPLPLPSHDPLPNGENSLKLKELMNLCTTLSNKVLYLESDVINIKSTYKAKIEKLKSRVERSEEENRVLKELKGVHFTINFDEPVMEKEESSKHGRKIADIDADVKINLEKVQAEAYNLDFGHQEKVLSMLDLSNKEPASIEELLKVVIAAKLITKVVTTAGVDVNADSVQDTPITAAEATKVIVKVLKQRKRRGVIIQDLEETTTTVIVRPKVQAKDKEKSILIEEPKPLKRQVQIDLDKEVVRQLEEQFNDDINWNAMIKQVKRSED